MRWCLVLLLSTLAWSASPRSAELSYQRGVGAERCPDEQSIRDAVAARLGYDPFATTPADLRIQVRLAKRGRRLSAEVETFDHGKPAGHRNLSAGTRECDELASAVELDISIAIDPLVLSKPAPRPPATTTVEPVPPARPPTVVVITAPAPPPPPAAAPAPEGPPVKVLLRVGATGAYGELPRINLGIDLNARVRIGRWSFGLLGQAGPNTQLPVLGGRIESGLVAGAAQGCVHQGWFAGCVEVLGGEVHAVGSGFATSRTADLPLVAVGARAELEIPFAKVWGVGFHVDVLAPVVKCTFLVGTDAVWSSSPVIPNAGVFLARTFG